MVIGPHAKRDHALERNKQVAVENGWGVFQTHWGSPRRVAITIEVPEDFKPQKVGPIWVLHSCYLAQAGSDNPKMRHVAAAYFRKLTNHASKVGAEYVVAHVGATKDKTAEEVSSSLGAFMEKSDLPNFLQDKGVKFLIENVATIAPFNVDPTMLPGFVTKHQNIGWCLDIAHSYAAGVPLEELLDVIRDTPPDICHCNYSASAFGSGKDKHGWLHKQLDSQGAITVTSENSQMVEYWTSVTKLVNELGVPLVVEGASIEGDMQEELDAVKAFCSGSVPKLESVEPEPAQGMLF